LDKSAAIVRPKRWDEPFALDMTDEEVIHLMHRPEFSSIDPNRFPTHIPLTGILKNDTRIMRYKSGDIIVREGDYGNSAFLVLKGHIRVVVSPGLPSELVGRRIVRKKNVWSSLAQLWTNQKLPEVRTMKRARQRNYRTEQSAKQAQVFLQDIPAILDAHKTARLGDGALFGELAALGRVPRTATVFCESEDTNLLEIRWQGLREFRKFDPDWRKKIDDRYRENALKAHLVETPLFRDLNERALQQVADHTLFETYGSFDWHVSYQKLRKGGGKQVFHEPVIAKQGDYPDGLLMIRAGFARVTMHHGDGERTLTYLGKGDYFGFDELYESWRYKSNTPLETSLTALGYIDVLRVPTKILEENVFAMADHSGRPRLSRFARRSVSQDALLEWTVDERLINGTQAMVIDLNKCTRCDDCVQACSTTHGGNPRFIRHGKVHDHWMVANACMHCVDPVCLIGCPTGAIHRTAEGGVVVINDETCIGCSTCANACPYDNIQMVNIQDTKGNLFRESDNEAPIQKATKCDLCVEQLGGPACVRACPHDAMKRTDILSLLMRSQSET
jgi:Fe-S-cluster-containing dehydrogenase component/CRP-like cAMP-binding protein